MAGGPVGGRWGCRPGRGPRVARGPPACHFVDASREASGGEAATGSIGSESRLEPVCQRTHRAAHTTRIYFLIIFYLLFWLVETLSKNNITDLVRFLELLVRYLEVWVKFLELLMRFVELLEKFLELLMRFLELFVKFLELLVKFLELLVRFLELLEYTCSRVPHDASQMIAHCGFSSQRPDDTRLHSLLYLHRCWPVARSGASVG